MKKKYLLSALLVALSVLSFALTSSAIEKCIVDAVDVDTVTLDCGMGTSVVVKDQVRVKAHGESAKISCYVMASDSGIVTMDCNDVWLSPGDNVKVKVKRRKAVEGC